MTNSDFKASRVDAVIASIVGVVVGAGVWAVVFALFREGLFDEGNNFPSFVVGIPVAAGSGYAARWLLNRRKRTSDGAAPATGEPARVLGRWKAGAIAAALGLVVWTIARSVLTELPELGRRHEGADAFAFVALADATLLAGVAAQRIWRVLRQHSPSRAIIGAVMVVSGVMAALIGAYGALVLFVGHLAIGWLGFVLPVAASRAAAAAAGRIAARRLGEDEGLAARMVRRVVLVDAALVVGVFSMVFIGRELESPSMEFMFVHPFGLMLLSPIVALALAGGRERPPP